MGQIAVKNIAFIGGGAMAKAIIKGIIGGGLIAPDMITVGEPTEAHARSLHEAFGVNVTTDNKEAVKDADLVIFAVKPQVAPVALVPELMAAMKKDAWVLSIMGSVTLAQLHAYAPGFPVVRTMPNTPLAAGAGMTAICCDEAVTEPMKQTAAAIFSSCGEIEFVDEKFNIQIVSNEVGIQETQRIKQAALIGVNGMNDEYQFRALDKDSEKSGIPSKFIGEFINGEKIDDDKYKTKVFKTSADNWITNALANDIKQAEDARSILNYTLKEQQQVDVAEFAERAIKDDDLKEGFKELMEEKGIDETFSIDKKWVEKKLKKRNIKTDNGF